MRKQKGFSLIELLIVVAIILIIAAIAIPNLLRARIAANESSAVSSIRTMNTAEITYQSTYPTIGYTPDIPTLGPPNAQGCTGATIPVSTNACLVDWVLSQATAAGSAKSGYYFKMALVQNNNMQNGYTFDGEPAVLNQTGVRGFCSNEDAVVRYVNPAAVSGSEAACAAYTALQ